MSPPKPGPHAGAGLLQGGFSVLSRQPTQGHAHYNHQYPEKNQAALSRHDLISMLSYQRGERAYRSRGSKTHRESDRQSQPSEGQTKKNHTHPPTSANTPHP